MSIDQINDSRPVEDAGERIVIGAMFQLGGQVLKPRVHLVHFQLGPVAATHEPTRFPKKSLVGKNQVAKRLPTCFLRGAWAGRVCSPRRQ